MNPISVNVPEAASILKVHPKTVEDLIHSGALPAAQIGRAWVMLSKDVRDYLEQQIISQTAARIGMLSRLRARPTIPSPKPLNVSRRRQRGAPR